MATNNLIQYLEPGVAGSNMNRSKHETFLASSAIAIGQTVALDGSQSGADRALYVVPSDTDSADAVITVGIAVTAAAAGKKVKVCVAGYCDKALVNTSVSKNDLLQIGATAGQLEIRTVAVNEGGAATFNLFPIVAQALEDDIAGYTPVIVKNQFT